MSQKTISRLLMIGGFLLMVVSLSADLIGIGAEAGFGLKQLTGTVVGLAALAYGYWLGRAKEKGKK